MQLPRKFCCMTSRRIHLICHSLINLLSTQDDFIHYFTICKPNLVVVDAEIYDVAVAALKRIPNLVKTEVVLLGKSKKGIVSVRCSIPSCWTALIRFSSHPALQATPSFPFLISHRVIIVSTQRLSVSAQVLAANLRV